MGDGLNVLVQKLEKVLILESQSFQNINSQKEVGRICLPELKMNSNMLPTEAIHSSLNLFENQRFLYFLMVVFVKKGPVYSQNGPTLDFEVAGDRNYLIDIQKIFLEIKCKIVQASEANLKCDAGAASDLTKTDAPSFCNNVSHLLFSDYPVSANGMKISNAN